MTDEQHEGPFEKLVRETVPPVNIGEWTPSIFEFTQIGCYQIEDRGKVIEVKNPGDIVNPGKYVGTYVTIDETKYKVRGVESFRPALPYPDHLTFAFLVEEVETEVQPTE